MVIEFNRLIFYLVLLASHMGPGSCPVFSPTNMAPTYGPGKAVEVGPVLGPPSHPHWKLRWSSWLRALVWLNTGPCSHWRNKLADGCFSVLPSLFVTVTFKYIQPHSDLPSFTPAGLIGCFYQTAVEVLFPFCFHKK